MQRIRKHNYRFLNLFLLLVQLLHTLLNTALQQPRFQETIAVRVLNLLNQIVYLIGRERLPVEAPQYQNLIKDQFYAKRKSLALQEFAEVIERREQVIQ
jgi:hypothetical protein